MKLTHCSEADGPTQTDRWCLAGTLSADIVAVACTAVVRGPADTRNLASAKIVKIEYNAN